MNYLSFIAIFFSIISCVISGFVLWNLKAANKLRKSFAGAHVDLEQILAIINNNIQTLEQRLEANEQGLAAAGEMAKYSVQQMGIVRFNPFGDSGGNFSFSLALLDAHNTGVVITSMHGRQQNRIYTKRIQRGVSEVTLTDEEQKAIDQANKNSK